MATVVLLGTLDTKGIEYNYVRQRIQAEGCGVLLIDAGILGTPLAHPDISREEVAKAAGANLSELITAQDRGKAVETMARGATIIVHKLYAQGRLHGIFGVGGSGNTTIVAEAMRGKLDPVIRRYERIRRVIQRLELENKNTPLHTGRPGDVKTANGEELDGRIVHGDVPAANEQRAHGGHVGVEPSLHSALDALQIGLGRRHRLVGGHQQRDVDRRMAGADVEPEHVDVLLRPDPALHRRGERDGLRARDVVVGLAVRRAVVGEERDLQAVRILPILSVAHGWTATSGSSSRMPIAEQVASSTSSSRRKESSACRGRGASPAASSSWRRAVVDRHRADATMSVPIEIVPNWRHAGVEWARQWRRHAWHRRGGLSQHLQLARRRGSAARPWYGDAAAQAWVAAMRNPGESQRRKEGN